MSTRLNRPRALLCTHGRLANRVTCAWRDAVIEQSGSCMQRRSNTGIDHVKTEPMLAREHVDGRAAAEIVCDHLCSDVLRERTDTFARHPVIGEREASRAGADRAAQLLVRWHHEWWNGAGYPDALRRQEIPLAARILRVADSFASLTDERPYRPAMSIEAAKRELIERAGIEFDPAVVSTLLSIS